MSKVWHEVIVKHVLYSFGKHELQQKEKHERDIAKSLEEYDRQSHPVQDRLHQKLLNVLCENRNFLFKKKSSFRWSPCDIYFEGLDSFGT